MGSWDLARARSLEGYGCSVAEEYRISESGRQYHQQLKCSGEECSKLVEEDEKPRPKGNSTAVPQTLTATLSKPSRIPPDGTELSLRSPCPLDMKEGTAHPPGVANSEASSF